MADFKLALPALLEHEGVTLSVGVPVEGKTGYVNDPADAGGETNYGITISEARRYGYTGPMADIPFETVITIYKARYWDVLCLDDVPDQGVAAEILDAAVNCGVGTASGWVRRIVNGLNKEATLWGELPATYSAATELAATLARCLAIEGNRTVFLRLFDSLQGAYYIGITERNPKNEKFIRGWALKRLGGY